MNNVSHITNEASSTGFCTSLYNTGVSGANWLGKAVKDLANGASDSVQKIWTVVSSFFARGFQHLSAFAYAAKNTLVSGVVSAKDALANLPTETKSVALAVVCLAAIGLGVARLLRTETVAATAAQATTNANHANENAADLTQQAGQAVENAAEANRQAADANEVLARQAEANAALARQNAEELGGNPVPVVVDLNNNPAPVVVVDTE